MDRAAAVVVTYNRKDLLIRCVSALLKQTEKKILDILIIDNHSTDGTGKALQPWIDSGVVRYLDTGKNLGGAGGFHYGIKYAVEQGYRWLWLMDDDTIPTETALEEYLKEDERRKGAYGFLSGKVLWKDDSICVMNVQKETKWRRLKNNNQSGRQILSANALAERDQNRHPDRMADVNCRSQRRIQYASFVSLFLRSEVVLEVGLPYKEFFIWADDWEYTRRISKRESSFYVPQSVVHHWCQNNVGADIVEAPEERIDRFTYMYRNDVVLYRQDGWEGWLYLTIRNMIHWVRILLKADHKKRKWSIIRRGTKEGKQFFPTIEYPASGVEVS